MAISVLPVFVVVIHSHHNGDAQKKPDGFVRFSVSSSQRWKIHQGFCLAFTERTLSGIALSGTNHAAIGIFVANFADIVPRDRSAGIAVV